MRYLASVMLIGSLSLPVGAAEPTQGITITGDKELPQVLYIIPWQEQRAAMPAAPELPNPIRQPLTPCDTGQALDDYLADLWQCPEQPVSK